MLDLRAELALLLGAILVVTGPTVIGPLLRHARPHGSVGSILKLEGIINDWNAERPDTQVVPMAIAGAEELSGSEMRSLDGQVQEIKSDVLNIAAELNNLEERLLFPSNT